MPSLTKLALTLVNHVLLLVNNWLAARKARKHEERVATVRAAPASSWLHKFGGKTDNRTSPDSADTGGNHHERIRLPPA